MAALEDPTTYGAEPVQRERVSLLSVLRRRALIVLFTAILCGGAAAAFAYARSDSYSSTAKLLFRQTVGPELNALGYLYGAPYADNLAMNDAQVVGSRRVAAATATELRKRGVNVSTDNVAGDVTVTRAKGTDIVDVLATGTSAARAGQLADVYSRTAQTVAEGYQRQLSLRTLDNVRTQLARLSPADRKGFAGGRMRSDMSKLKTLADVGTGSPQIIQPGYVPTAQSSSPVQTIVIGALFGVLLGVGFALLREQADRRLHRPEEVSAAFDAPVLTTVPRHRALKRHKPFADLPPEVAEAFRMLQMNLRFAGSQPVRSVLVTSSRTREGKTTVAWNLASASASAGLSVALVEADMRRPSMAQRYDLQPEPGLAEALRGEVSVANALQPVLSVAKGGSVNGHALPVDVLVAGSPPPDPWALMQSSVMPRVLDVLKGDHDLVVIDTPPIPHVADAISLLRRVEGVIVTASVNSTRGPEAGRLRHQLQTLDARVLGVVANGGSAMNGYAYAPVVSPVAARGDAL